MAHPAVGAAAQGADKLKDERGRMAGVLWRLLFRLRPVGDHAFRRQREDVARHLAEARSETAARQFRVCEAFPESPAPRLDRLPPTITWRRAGGRGRFEIRYEDGADLLAQLAAFLHAASANREEFFEGTEPEG